MKDKTQISFWTTMEWKELTFFWAHELKISKSAFIREAIEEKVMEANSKK